MTSILPVIAGVLILLFMMFTLRPSSPPGQKTWMFPALLSLLFLAWSIFAIITEGPFGFWSEHIGSLWGNQIWFDLLLAIGIGWYFLLPKAKSHGMRLPLWIIFILCTGCIGLLAMASRVLYLEQKPAL